LLEGDPATLSLVERNPFPDDPPRFIRAELYRYHFAPPGDQTWWRRERLRDWFPPLSKDDPRLQEFLRGYGWLAPHESDD